MVFVVDLDDLDELSVVVEVVADDDDIDVIVEVVLVQLPTPIACVETAAVAATVLVTAAVAAVVETTAFELPNPLTELGLVVDDVTEVVVEAVVAAAVLVVAG